MRVTKTKQSVIKSVPHALVTRPLTRLSQPALGWWFFPLERPLDTLLQLGLGVKFRYQYLADFWHRNFEKASRNFGKKTKKRKKRKKK